MPDEKRIETIQDEIKLLKGELKQSLTSVRDYLLNMELPSSEFSTILAALGSEGEQKVTMKGTFAPPQENMPAGGQDELAETASEDVGGDGETIEDESELPGEDEDLIDVENPLEDEESETLTEGGLPGGGGGGGGGGSTAPQEALLAPENAIADEEANEPGEQPDEEDEPIMSEPEMPEEEEQPVSYDKTIAATTGDDEEIGSTVPKVNMLTNLMNWVSRAKKEIGCDQLPMFLEVYGISGHLSPELKEVILHFSEITAEHPEAITNAELWSQLMLSLHGILTGGDAPLHPVIPAWNEGDAEPAEEEIIEVDKNKEKEEPVKLKLVFPAGDGKSKEFCIDLNPEVDEDDSSSKRKK